MNIGTRSVNEHNSQPDTDSMDVRTIYVKRSLVLSDVLKWYEDASILRYRLAVKLDGEASLEYGGVTKDLFGTFWETAVGK